MLKQCIAFAFACALIASAAAQQTPPGVDQRAVMAAQPPQLLSAYRFFVDVGARNPNAGVTPYDLNTPLYSDGALKFRYLYLPPGAKATYRDEGVFEFPIGTVLIKTFAFAADMRQPGANVRFLETRLLIHRADGWIALPYVWNEAQTEARLSPIGASVPVRFINEAGADTAFDWAVPNRNQCTGCHAREGGNTVLPLGPTARNFNRQMFYSGYVPSGPDTVLRIGDGSTQNQLAHWSAAGILDQLPAEAPRAPNAYDPTSGTLEARARTYLDVNCSHCHNPNGPAHTSGLDLRYAASDPAHWGVLKRPVAAGQGSGNMSFVIAPGHPEQSILVYRMQSTDPGEMMPELGRQLVDQRAVALMREWIANMDAQGRQKP